MLIRTTGILLLLISGLLLPGMSHASLNVFACEPEWAALVKELGGEKLTVFAATTALQDPHHIQARPSLIAKARRADLLICSGAELEIGWLSLLLRKASNKKIQPGENGYFMAADYVEKVDVPVTVDRSLGDVHAEGNPHIHTSPENILRVADALYERLNTIDAENAGFYREKYQSFRHRWQQSMEKWRRQAAGLNGINIVTHHTYWSYLNHWAKMNVLATLEPVAGVSPSSSHLAKVRDQVSGQTVKMIVRVAYVSERPSQWLSERTGVPVVVLPGTVDFQDGQSLTHWFDGVIEQLVEIK